LVHTYDSSSNSEDKLPKLSTKSVEPVVDSDNNSNQSQSGGIFSFLQLKKQSSKTEKVKERKKVALTTLSTIPSQLTYKSRSNSPDRPGIKLKITSSASKSAQNECFNPFLVDESKPDNDDQEEQPSSSKTEVKPEKKEKKEKKKASDKHKRKLEKALRKCGKKIQDLEEAPIDWDKDEDSNFIMASKLKNRFIAIHKKIAEYKEEQVNLQRRSDKKFTFSDVKYPEIGKKIEKFVNRTKEFPDFNDIKKEVEEINKRKKLMLSEMKVHSEAERLFVATGRKLKRRRFDDDAASMYSYLKEDDQGDPAAKDFLLDQKLVDLGKTAKKKLDTVFEEFVEKQMNKKDDKSEEDLGDLTDDAVVHSNLLSDETKELLQTNDFEDKSDDENSQSCEDKTEISRAEGISLLNKFVAEEEKFMEELERDDEDYLSDEDDSKKDKTKDIDENTEDSASLDEETSFLNKSGSNVDDLLDSMSESED